MKNLTKKITICLLALFIAGYAASCVYGQAEAQKVSYKSALIWSQEQGADFTLPSSYNITEYVSGDSVYTDAPIKYISASWEAEGKVALELSVNGGFKYYKVTNGAPLDEDFITGNRIKWIAHLEQGADLKEVKIVYRDASNTTASFGESALTGFRYRKMVHIPGPDSAKYNHVMNMALGKTGYEKEDSPKEVIWLDRIVNDFIDIRITTADGETLIPYYREETLQTSDSTALIWMKIPEIPSEGADIYIYYGNPAAKDLSSAKKVFGRPEKGEEEWLTEEEMENMLKVDLDEEYDEEIVSLPEFYHTVLAQDGNIILDDMFTEGTYRMKGISTEYEARILVPSWEGKNISVDISADGGLTYQKECEKEAYYYASKGDIEPGMNIKAKVNFEVSITPAELEEITLEYAPGNITVVSPNGGEKWNQGTRKDILWAALEYDPSYPMKIEYSINGGASYQEITETVNSGMYTWAVPKELDVENAVVRLSDANDNEINDASDSVFAIGQYEEEAIKDIEERTEEEEETKEDMLLEEMEEEMDLAEFLAMAKNDPLAEPREILIKVIERKPTGKDEGRSYKAGDIVVIKPVGHKWSETEKNSFLILKASLSNEAVKELMAPYYRDTGRRDKEGNAIMKRAGRRKYRIDLNKFDLKTKRDGIEAPVRKYLKQEVALENVLKEAE